MFDDERIDQKLIDECLPGYTACMIFEIYIIYIHKWVPGLPDSWMDGLSWIFLD